LAGFATTTGVPAHAEPVATVAGFAASPSGMTGAGVAVAAGAASRNHRPAWKTIKDESFKLSAKMLSAPFGENSVIEPPPATLNA
jgi:hypothetical protein